MKFSWKIILLVTLVLAIALSIGGYAIVWSAFDTQIQSEIEMAQDDMQMFSLMLQAMGAEQTLEPSELSSFLLEKLTGNNFISTHRFAVLASDGSYLLRTDDMIVPGYPTARFSGTIDSQLVQSNGYYITSLTSIPFAGRIIHLQMAREVTACFTQAAVNLQNYQIIMAGLLLVSILLTACVTFFMTKPLSSVSAAASRFAAGNYDERVSVSTDDEVGALAGSFNEMADALESKIQELRDALEHQKEFTESFAHELKTPLTSVIGYADTLRSRSLPPDMQMEAAGYIISEGKRLEAMSVALLDLFALENHRPEFQEVSMVPLLQKVEQSCAYFLQCKDVKLHITAQDARLQVVPELLHAMLYNLIDNACKASESGTVIEISGKMQEGAYLVSVTDHGRGMPQEALSRIKEPFFMVDKSRARAQGGAGLGLALCERIAKIHGTTLQFESEEGKGTVVTIVLGGAEE